MADACRLDENFFHKKTVRSNQVAYSLPVRKLVDAFGHGCHLTDLIFRYVTA
jgi:hypothetical protein